MGCLIALSRGNQDRIALPLQRYGSAQNVCGFRDR